MTSRPTHILVIDDDEAKRYGITRRLQQCGFSTKEGVNGREALALAAEQPDLIILDVNLPDLSGIEVCRKLKADPATAHIPILHISATFIASEHRVEGLESGADAYLTDIVNPSEMIATIRALLRARHAERALRESEDRFRMLVRNVRDYAIFTCDPQGRLTTWNEGVLRILGYTSESFVGEHYATLFDVPGEAQAQLDTAQSQGQIESERWFERRDGTRFIASCGLAAIHDDAGSFVGFTGIIRDITERRAAEEERARLLEREQAFRLEAERSNRLKDEFLATLSHELRTPLMAILGWTQLLQMSGDKTTHFEEAIAVIDRNAKVQAQLIEDLLDVSRIISGKLRLDVKTIELEPVVQAAVQAVQAAAIAKGIEIRIIADPSAGPVAGDAGRLQQIIWNLLSNAIKFTPRQGRIMIRLSRVNSHVEIAVEDNGQGIEPEFLPYVFERFRQADASTSRLHAGLGLGLAIVRHLAELHGGTVRADSGGAGHGAVFTLELPLMPVTPPLADADDDASRAPAAHASNFSRLPDLTGMKILVVEDEADARTVLRHALEQSGACVRVASSAVEAVAAFEDERPDVLISDIGMPGEDGYALIRRVRALESDGVRRTPALALTAFARSEDRQRALMSGFQMHVPKPVIPAELITAVASLGGRTGC